MKKFVGTLVLIFLSVCGTALAQHNEIGATVGGQVVFGSYNVGYSGVFQIDPAHRILDARLAEAYVEVPLAWSFNSTNVDPIPGLSDQYSAFYVAPGVKLKLLPQFPVSPYGFVGVGLARFHDRNNNAASYASVVDYGAGLDWKVLPLLSIRTELRDYNSGAPDLGYPVPLGRQQNVMATAGLVLHF
jgi:hypothetical protein